MGDVNNNSMPTPSIYGILPAKAVLVLTGSSGMLALLQASTPIPDISFIGQVERLGLVGALIAAVIVLWRKLDTKDTSFSESSVNMVKALALNNQLMSEMKDMMKDIKESNDELRRSVDRSVSARVAVSDIRQLDTR